MTFDVLPGHPDAPVVIHVPHAATAVPDDARGSILLDDASLADELGRMTDAHTDLLAEQAVAAHPGPWRFVNRLSRYVVDPERFPDDTEEMLAVGMGPVYTRTSRGEPLRDADPGRDAAFLDRWFRPYADALADLVDDRLAATGRAVLVDLHSYPTDPLPCERHPDDGRPQVCLGTHPEHTPGWLLAAAREAFADFEVGVDGAFKGTYVPLRHFRRDPRVSSLMVEIRRDTYMDEPGGDPHEGFDELARALARVLDYVGGSDRA